MTTAQPSLSPPRRFFADGGGAVLSSLLSNPLLRRWFGNRPNAIQTEAGAEALPTRSLQPHWIVGRGLAMYRCQDFSRVPRPRRHAAVALQVAAWSPFADTGWRCVWSGGTAMVWYWDAAAVSVREEVLGADGRGTPHVVPESLFQPRGDDGARVVRCHDGHDLQFWRGGALLDSIWSRAAPDAERIAWFLERLGQPAGAGVPVVDAPLAAEPWSRTTSPLEWLRENETAIGATALAVLALACVWQEARHWKTRYATAAAAAEVASVQDTVLPQLSARTDFLDLRRRNERLAALFGQPSQARLMGVVDETLPSPTARFREWRFSEGELTLVVEDEALDRVAFVRALEAHPWFTGVSAEQGRRQGQVSFAMRVDGT